MLAGFWLFSFDLHTAAQSNGLVNTGYSKTVSFNTPDEINTTTLYNTPWLTTVANKTTVIKAQSYGTSTPIRTTKTVSEEKLRQYLESKRSPLAPHSELLLQSEYWGLLIAITSAEQSFYKQPQSSPFNIWGRMHPRCCILKKYASFPEAIADMDVYFRDYWEGRRDIHTVERLNGSYVVPASPNWFRTVTTVKREVESL